jgi:AcrR family transcriptional regulator
VISREDIERAFARAEAEATDPATYEPEIRAGDWVRLVDEGRLEAWSKGHVIAVNEAGLLLGYGGRNASRDMWLLGLQHPVDAGLVVEVWRRVPQVTEETVAGLHTRSLSDEWVQLI